MEPFYRPPANCQVPDLAEKWERLFGCSSAGFFVEVGAYDGDNFSNTSCLADVGWSGIYIEPVPEFAEQCRQRHKNNPQVRVLEYVVSDAEGTTDIYLGGWLTTIVPEQVADFGKISWAKGRHEGIRRFAPTDTLDAILDRHGVPAGFDVLVVDVEGAEDKVFAGFDIGRWRPKVMLVELEDEHPDFISNARVRGLVGRIRTTIESQGYSVYFRDHINTLYVRSDWHAFGRSAPQG